MASTRIRSVTALCLGLAALIGLLGVIDHWTGRELNFFLFYFVPVGLAGHYLGTWPSVAIAILCTGTWALAGGTDQPTGFLPLWNGMVRCVAFVVIGVSFARIGRLLKTERETAQQLREARSQLRILEGLLPICAYCKRIRDEEGQWEQLETYITHRSEATFSHGICPACKHRFMETAGVTEE